MKVIREDFPPTFSIKEKNFVVEKTKDMIEITDKIGSWSLKWISFSTKDTKQLIKALQIIIDTK